MIICPILVKTLKLKNSFPIHSDPIEALSVHRALYSAHRLRWVF